LSLVFVLTSVLSKLSKCLATVLLLALLVLTGCASQSGAPAAEHANHAAPVATDVEHCAYLLSTFLPVDDRDTVDREFSMAVWNAQKITGSPWLPDFGWLTDSFDLVLIQEFALTSDWQEQSYLSFAPGFGARQAVTGVATLSRIKPLSRCELNAREPMLRTPKATAIARFPMAGGESLVVVNLHAVNFSFGLVNFGNQLRDAVQAVAYHDGPLIFSGDFNTWRADRLALVDQLLADLDLLPVQFANDERKKIFGRYLDHIYIRGLEVLEATTQVVDASDHNPMFVRLRL
jgi:endonuclease/exonuclease/phosphatase family metal-dependent hydrolase